MLNRLWIRLTPRNLALLLIGLPLLLAGLYFGLAARDRYVSEAVLTVRRAQQDGPGASGLMLLIPGSGGASTEDTRMLHDYILSQGLMLKLDAELGLRQHFEAPGTDPFYRLWPGSTREVWLDYWRSRLEITLDELSGLLTVRVQAFDPVFAQRVNAALLRESETFVNTITQRIAREQTAFVQGELERADQVLTQARAELMTFQARNRMVDPAAQVSAAGSIAVELRGQLARVESELRTKTSYLNTDAPEIIGLRAQVEALRQQIANETRDMAAPRPNALNRLTIEFHELKARALMAEEQRRMALATVEATRVETIRKAKSLVVVEPPTLAESAEYPRRLYNLITVLLSSLMLYAVVRLLVATINEHRD